MTDGITRRDFMNGVAIGVAGALAAGKAAALPEVAADAPYPPRRYGLRGSHPGSFEVAHALRDGQRFDASQVPIEEEYDLVVVGGGISGLATAYYYRQHRPAARVLVLETNDDFGGHAKRNEFTVDGRLLIGYGGTQSIDSPKHRYRGVPARLLRELGVDVERFAKAYDRTEYARRQMTRATFFKREAFGVDRLVREPYARWDSYVDLQSLVEPLRAALADYPVDAAARATLLEMHTSQRDVLAGFSAAERRQIAEHTSYRDFIRRYWNANDDVVRVLENRTHGLWAVGIDAVSVSNVLELPGCQSLRHGTPDEFQEPYIYHFPDGNASIARLLVRRLVPGAAPGTTMEDIVTARVDYDALDSRSQNCRIRLGATVVEVRNAGRAVEAAYVRDGTLHRVRAQHAVLACYHCVMPYLAPDLGADQRAALAQNVRAPLVYATVAVRNWRAWEQLGVAHILNPGGMYDASLDFPVSLGDYRFAEGPDQPICIHLQYVPTAPNQGLGMREQFRAGRARLLQMSFADFEGPMRDELHRMLGAGGFEFDRDVAAITVNRWPHGYAYTPDPLWDDAAKQPALQALARRRIGRIAIANSDSGWDAYTDVAIREAHRAVGELLS